MDLRSVTPSDSTVASPNGERLDGTSGFAALKLGLERPERLLG